jgi:hypothetical protein
VIEIMSNQVSSPVGVCVFADAGLNKGRSVNYPGYVHEVLAHAGVPFEPVAPEDLAGKLGGVKILVTVGEQALVDDAKAALKAWVEAGGSWLSIAGTCGLEDVVGAKQETPTYVGWATGLRSLGEGFLKTDGKHPVLGFVKKPLHFFGGAHLKATDGTVLATALDKHAREQGGVPAVIEKKTGKGRSLLIAADVTGTIVRVQQGLSVTRDGVAASDGSAPIDDYVLKSGDGGVLDFVLDRDPVPGVSGLNAFLTPIADQWRQILLGSIFYLAQQAGVALPVLWMWPRNLPAIGHVSHDTDGNDPKLCERLLESLRAAKIRSTWCVIAPGYDKRLIGQIREAGHELCMHYDAMTEGLDWSEKNFDEQFRFLTDLLETKIVTNKNHYLRWEGDMEFFEWCQKRGIKLDQSKGASKTGEAGFNFGTCHPHFPVYFRGEFADVLELPTPTQDLTVFAPEDFGVPLMEASIAAHGVVHYLFHPAHFAKEPTPRAMERMAEEGRQRGIEWWTAKQINDWERARRTVKWSGYGQDATGTSVTLTAGAELGGATLMWLAPKGSVGVDGRACGGTKVTRWGFDFTAGVTDVGQGKHTVTLGTK